MNPEHKEILEATQLALAHLQCGDSDFRYTVNKVTKLVRDARVSAFEEAANLCDSMADENVRYNDEYRPYTARGCRLSAHALRSIAIRERKKGCELDTDGDGYCHTHPTGCPK